MVIFLILLLFISIIFILVMKKTIEKFTVGFREYQDPYFGFCFPALPKEKYESGKFKTQCWPYMAYEDCQLLNSQGYNCGYNIETGETLPCVHNKIPPNIPNKCKDEPQCFSTCNDQVPLWKQPYMIKVESDKLISLTP